MGKEINIEELRSIQLSLLDSFHKWCHKNHINYSLAYGSLLGAVRHKGFIPWDDDIDVMMTREDYNRLVSIYNYEDCPAHTKVLSLETDKQYVLPFAKIIDTRTAMIENDSSNCVTGVYIDIFPYDFVPNNKIKRMCRCSIQKTLFIFKDFKLVKIGFPRRSIFKNAALAIGKLFLLPFSVRCISKCLEKVAVMSKESTSYICDAASFLQAIFPSSLFMEYTEIPFEGKQYRIIKNYDRYLSTIYGDYMKLPPEEKRVTHHEFKAWWI